jgi:hypothetical protein
MIPNFHRYQKFHLSYYYRTIHWYRMYPTIQNCQRFLMCLTYRLFHSILNCLTFHVFPKYQMSPRSPMYRWYQKSRLYHHCQRYHYYLKSQLSPKILMSQLFRLYPQTPESDY